MYLVSEDGSELGSPSVRISCEESEGIELCTTDGVSNVKYGGNIG